MWILSESIFCISIQEYKRKDRNGKWINDISQGLYVKKLIVVILFISTLFGSNQKFLSPDDAFKLTVISEKEKVVFELDLGKDIYLYPDKLKVKILKPQKMEITNKLNIPKVEFYKGLQTISSDVKFEISNKLLESKVKAGVYELEINYQGCSKVGICYPPMKKKFVHYVTESK